MSNRKTMTIDSNEAVAYVSYRLNDVIGIYPITPSSPIAEFCDEWAAKGMKNLWGTVPLISEMEHEGGAAAAVHGALQTGALSTTFTASQGLLLMIPTMYKIAGELTPTVFHVTARTLATHALSIFGDHSDVMAVRQTGFALLSSASVQESHDMALISQAATMKSRIPFVHFSEGFRISHEVAKIELLTEEDLKAMITDEMVAEQRARAMKPEKPVLRGTAQNPDVFFQGREACNPFYNACADIVQQAMDDFKKITGREYKLFQYHGAPDAERVIVIMGSGCETSQATVDYLMAKGEKVGLLKVRLFRPFDIKRCVEALPASVKAIAVMDRTKEPGSLGDPLYLDIVTAINEAKMNGIGSLKDPKIIAGRYGLSSKEFTPAMVKAIFDNLKQTKPQHHFTIGIDDDVTKTSLKYDPNFSIEGDDVVRALFYGLGSDGTVGANKNSIKIIGEDTQNFAQGYFVYDSKKSGSMTVSHLRFGPKEIHSPTLVSKSNFVACHQPVFLEKYDMLESIEEKGTFLLNTAVPADKIWETLPEQTQKHIVEKKLKFYVIDATRVAGECGMGNRINTIMQTCFFGISGVLPKDKAIEAIKKSIKKTYGKKGEDVVNMNIRTVDQTMENLHEVKVPSAAESKTQFLPPVTDDAPDYVKNVLGKIIAGKGDQVKVSEMPVDGTFPTATARYEKRNLALEIPVWDPAVCIQCGKCSSVCPHACIRPKVYAEKLLDKAPATFKSAEPKDKEFKEAGMKYTLQVAAEDCTGCGVCVTACPAKNKADASKKAINMENQPPLRMAERENWDFFVSLPEVDRTLLKPNQLRHQQLMQPLFEFSGACAGCGETPYVKMISQLFGDRMIVANATGCSSIYGGNLPTTPWSVNKDGVGPTWNNSLFEDAAEFGFGMRLSQDKQAEFAAELALKLKEQIGANLVEEILNNQQKTEPEIFKQREKVAELKKKVASINSSDAKQLLAVADALCKKSVWVMGGDGWAYDIGYGGLDHVLASGRNINVLVMDTETYSNTGGQMSKATPKGAVVKFAGAGKRAEKKELGLMAMNYGNVYVAKIALGANDAHTLKAILEAEAYEGPSLIIAYCHCIAHGINLTHGLNHQKMAVETGQWPLYRYNPELIQQGKNPFQLDSKEGTRDLAEYMYSENRFKMLTKADPETASRLLEEAKEENRQRYAKYKYLADRDFSK
jgi:pyruvate-ferredoxin/flavodoxin oxidoreductase